MNSRQQLEVEVQSAGQQLEVEAISRDYLMHT